MSTESVTPSSHLIFYHPLLLPSLFPSIRVFSSESAFLISWPKCWNFSFSISSSSEYSGLISFRTDWFDLLAVQGTLESLQHHRSKASILWCSAFFIVQLSDLYMTTGKTIALTRQTFADKPRHCIKKQRYHFAHKSPSSKSYGFSSSHVWMWGLDHKEGRMPKNWCLQTVVLEKTSESPLYSKEIKPVNLKGDQPWIFTGKTDAKAEALVFWSTDVHRWLIGKVPNAGKDQGQEEKRAPEDEMAEWHH